MSDATQIFQLPPSFQMHRGGTLQNAHLAYETLGTLSANRDNAVLILTGLSPGAHAAASPQNPEPGWWDFMIGPGKPIDTQHWFVICANSLGSCMGSTGANSIDPASGQKYRTGFPDLALEDIARSSGLLIAHLGIERLAALVGPSMGGMTALAYLAQHPGAVRSLLSISSAPYSLPFATALRSIQREAIANDPDFQDGAYDSQRWPQRGMRLARKIGMATYRSAREWDERFQRQPLEGRALPHRYAAGLAIEGYLDAAADRFSGQFDPCCYLSLSRAMDWFDFSACGAASLQASKLQRALVIGVETDLLFPLHQQREIAQQLQDAGAAVDFLALSSLQGHDAFLVDQDQFRSPVAAFFTSLHS